MRFRCVECASTFDSLPADPQCSCGGVLDVDFDIPELPDGWRVRPLGVWRYREFLPPLPPGAEIVTLSEGGTPLVDAPRLADDVGVKRLQLKVEGQNPTGSFKDRGMTYAVSWYNAKGATTVGCASTGNTSASMAAYAARAGMRAVVLLPKGKVAQGKLAQTLAFGARLDEVDGSFDEAMRQVIERAKAGEFALLNSKNPLRLEGQKSLVLEVLDQRDLAVPDAVVFPVGNAGNISAAHKALRHYTDLGVIETMPRLMGVQAEGAAPVARAIRENADKITPVERPETAATAIRIGAPVSATKALRAIRDTGGTAVAVKEGDITKAQRDLARMEGVLPEPASAATLAGLRRFVEEGALGRHDEVVLVLTGHGLKDPDAMLRLATGR